ncbi:hydroxypyruvate isomerase [Paraburkholderia sp. BL6665CI2N2]|uniref:hydroxypyruvate isomerase family protein n=1 Tax=Paraburkholderia sp. BL6665CI2N2 TaxID=1938806 RepID=UPI0010650A43|nr:TIM barrel protein [Paraburkholderia sp. BL6665CI2N2]TDY22028.1 hydroxypyruvate isomerase [Paraburkholderia sp. BL6665CI2N2]
MGTNRLSVNLSTLFTEAPLAQRFGLASASGFACVEMQYPYELPAHEVKQRLDNFHQTVALVNAPLGSEPQRRGLAAVIGQREAFRSAFLHGLEYANTLNCGLLHVLSGVVDLVDHDAAQAIWLDNMVWAAGEAGSAGVTTVVEALNPVDVPGYFIRSLAHAASLIEQVESPYLKLLFDTYHCAMSGADCAAELSRWIPRVGHVQIADCPGRAEPGTGAIDWARLFDQLHQSGYCGAIGLEFRNQQSVPRCFDAVNHFVDHSRLRVGASS